MEYIKSDYWPFGHNHNPNNYYQGSYVPNSIAEAGQARQIRVYTNGSEHIHPAPRIVDYFSVKFPDPLPETDVEIPIYTISNCKEEETAKGKYPDVFIRRVLFDLSMDDKDFDKLTDIINMGDPNSSVSITDMLGEFLTATKLTPELKEKTLLYLKESLKKVE